MKVLQIKNLWVDKDNDNTFYFESDEKRDALLNSYHPNWRRELSGLDNKAQVELEFSILVKVDKKDLDFKNIKNYKLFAVQHEVGGEEVIRFYNLIEYTISSNKSIINLSLEENVFFNETGFLNNERKFILNEGHVNLIDLHGLELDAGNRTFLKSEPLRRDFDFSQQYPNIDIKHMNNEWVFVVVKANDNLYKLNNQVLPYSVYIAPKSTITAHKGNRNDISVINYFFSPLSGDWFGSQDEKDYAQEYIFNLNSQPQEGESVNIKAYLGADFARTSEGDVTASDYIARIPWEFWQANKGKWFPVFFGDKLRYVNDYIFSNKIIEWEGEKNAVSTLVCMKYDELNNRIKFRAYDKSLLPEYTENISYHFLMVGKNYGLHTYWDKYYWNSNGDIHYYNDLGQKVKVTGKGDDWDNVWSEMNKNPTWRCYGSYAFSAVYYPNNDTPDKPFEIKYIYNGEDNGETARLWTANSLMQYINEQSQPDKNINTAILNAYSSSFNPLEIGDDGKIKNLLYSDGSEIDWENFDDTKIVLLKATNTADSRKLNTYDLEKYINKSWIKGMENYSILIENNKSFDIKPEILRNNRKFTHRAIITPKSLTERIEFANDITQEGYIHVNNKELMFAVNGYNDMLVNNPRALSNANFKYHIELIKSGLSMANKSSMGMLLGMSQLGNTLVERKNWKNNLANLKEKPNIDVGSGNGYSDLYLNKEGFSLIIVEWLYTTYHAKTLIENFKRNGVQIDGGYFTFNYLKRPEFNYIKIGNENDYFLNVAMRPEVKDKLKEIISKGVRLWYNKETYLNFDAPNGLTLEGSINYIE